jgi:sialidase-1
MMREVMQPESSFLRDLSTGILYKNPKPHIKSVHAYFPSVAAMPNGELLAAYALGEAFEAVNLRTHLGRSSDNGRTWRDEGEIYTCRSNRVLSDTARLAIALDGELVAYLMRCDRTDHLDEGLTNPATMGFVPNEILITRSTDGGHAWSEPVRIEPPLVGPCFEICSPITFLRDSRWLLPTSTWLDWEGRLPNGNRMVAFVSTDRGQSWPAYLDVMHDASDDLIFWESKIVELSDGRLVAVAWCYDRKANADRPNQYATSRDGGATWTPPQSTGLLGQTLTHYRLPDDRLLCVYRRMDKPGLWVTIARLEGDQWVNGDSQPLWGARSGDGHTAHEDSMVETFHGLKFGAPAITSLADGSLYATFWCYEQNISVIRWFNFRIV